MARARGILAVLPWLALSWAGADPMPNEAIDSVLYEATCHRGDVGLIDDVRRLDDLLERGADPRNRPQADDWDPREPIVCRMDQGDLHGVLTLLRHGVGLRDLHGDGAQAVADAFFLRAVRAADLVLVGALIAAGADVGAVAQGGETALALAVANADDLMAERLRSVGVGLVAGADAPDRATLAKALDAARRRQPEAPEPGRDWELPQWPTASAWIATEGRTAVVTQYGEIRIVSPEDGQVHSRFALREELVDVKQTVALPGQDAVAVAFADGALSLWSATANRLLWTRTFEPVASALLDRPLAYAAACNCLMLLAGDALLWLRTGDGEVLHQASIRSLVQQASIADTDRAEAEALYAGRDGGAAVLVVGMGWDRYLVLPLDRDGQLSGPLIKSKRSFDNAAVSADGRWLVQLNFEDEATIWDLDAGAVAARFRLGGDDGSYRKVLHLDGEQLLVATKPIGLARWSWRDGVVQRQWATPFEVTEASPGRDGGLLALGVQDGTFAARGLWLPADAGPVGDPQSEARGTPAPRYAEIRDGRFTAGDDRGWRSPLALDGAPTESAAESVQRPVLFDFARRGSDVVLVTGGASDSSTGAPSTGPDAARNRQQ